MKIHGFTLSKMAKKFSLFVSIYDDAFLSTKIVCKTVKTRSSVKLCEMLEKTSKTVVGECSGRMNFIGNITNHVQHNSL